MGKKLYQFSEDQISVGKTMIIDGSCRLQGNIPDGANLVVRGNLYMKRGHIGHNVKLFVEGSLYSNDVGINTHIQAKKADLHNIGVDLPRQERFSARYGKDFVWPDKPQTTVTTTRGGLKAFKIGLDVKLDSADTLEFNSAYGLLDAYAKDHVQFKYLGSNCTVNADSIDGFSAGDDCRLSSRRKDINAAVIGDRTKVSSGHDVTIYEHAGKYSRVDYARNNHSKIGTYGRSVRRGKESHIGEGIHYDSANARYIIPAATIDSPDHEDMVCLLRDLKKANLKVEPGINASSRGVEDVVYVSDNGKHALRQLMRNKITHYLAQHKQNAL